MDPLELSNLPLDQESEPATNKPTNHEEIESVGSQQCLHDGFTGTDPRRSTYGV